MNLFRLAAILASCFAFVAVGATASADEKAVDKDMLVGTWKLVFSGGKTAMEDVVIQITKDGKLKVTMKTPPGLAPGGKRVPAQTHTIHGTYSIEGDKLTITMKQGGKEHEETGTIKTLTDKKLVTVNPKGGEREFEKTK
jgi:uncharacterized protein (TIGR03066 family)